MQTQTSQTENILAHLGANHENPDVTESLKAIEDVKTTKFCWHPWQSFPFLTGNGPKFGILTPSRLTLDRMKLIPIPVFPVPHFETRKNGFMPGGFAGGDEKGSYFPAQGVTSVAKSVNQMPADSMKKLLKRYREFGLVDLMSLTARNDEEKAESMLLYHAVMSVPDSEGLIGDLLLMEDLPNWLKMVAPIQLDRAIREGVNVGGKLNEEGEFIGGQTVKARPDLRERGLQMIKELHGGILVAEYKALDRKQGILPETAKQLSTNPKSPGSKLAKDELDLWLLSQYPSFNMDSEAERASNVAVKAVKAGSEGRAVNEDRLASILEQQGKQIEILTEIIAGKAKGKTKGE